MAHWLSARHCANYFEWINSLNPQNLYEETEAIQWLDNLPEVQELVYRVQICYDSAVSSWAGHLTSVDLSPFTWKTKGGLDDLKGPF